MLLLAAKGGELLRPHRAAAADDARPAVCALGAALLAGVEPGSSYWTGVLPGVTIFGLGLTLLVAPLTATVLGAAPDRYAGVASGVNNAVARAGSLLAVAALPALLGLSGADYARPAIFSAAYTSAMWICSAMLAVGGLVSWLLIRNPVPEEVRPRRWRRHQRAGPARAREGCPGTCPRFTHRHRRLSCSPPRDTHPRPVRASSPHAYGCSPGAGGPPRSRCRVSERSAGMSLLPNVAGHVPSTLGARSGCSCSARPGKRRWPGVRGVRASFHTPATSFVWRRTRSHRGTPRSGRSGLLPRGRRRSRGRAPTSRRYAVTRSHAVPGRPAPWDSWCRCGMAW